MLPASLHSGVLHLASPDRMFPPNTDFADSRQVSARDRWVQRQMEEAMRHLPTDLEVLPSPLLLEQMEREAAQRREGCSFSPPQLRRSLPAPVPAANPSSSSRRKKRRCGAPACVSASKEESPTAASGAVVSLPTDVRAAASRPASSSATALSPRFAAALPMLSSLAPAHSTESPSEELEERLRFYARQIKSFRTTGFMYSSPELMERIRQMERDYETAQPTAGLQSAAAEQPTSGLQSVVAEQPTSGLQSAAAEQPTSEPQPDSRPDKPQPDSKPLRLRLVASAPAHATEGLCDASAPPLRTPLRVSATPQPLLTPLRVSAHASAPAHTTEGPANASAPAHATKGPANASASAQVTEGSPGSASASEGSPGSASASEGSPGSASASEGSHGSMPPEFHRVSGGSSTLLGRPPDQPAGSRRRPPQSLRFCRLPRLCRRSPRLRRRPPRTLCCKSWRPPEPH
ncbi:hypothetical protein CRENBAI_015015 [Crenichthys baileyi]|uniref:Uncharacterized protein n=1 Tax=Crenichthys baileyi TaxID=28760 RepID=A0AAV9STK6_9TELE